jgi:hypothetical protein
MGQVMGQVMGEPMGEPRRKALPEVLAYQPGGGR